MISTFRDKSILIAGGTGSIGSEIARNLLQYEPKVIRIFSNDENGLYNLENELHGHSSVRFLLGDVRDKERLGKAIEGIDIVFHAAALKHVPFCEYNPFEAIKTNVIGTQNVLEASLNSEVQSVISISTDKAVNPVSTMGATKLLSEKLVIDANYYKGNRKTIFISVRFGNVIDSRGSVFPFFAEQIKRGGPVTITDSRMTRFIMSPSQVINLLFRTTGMALGGEIFILKMPSLKISDLAEAMIDELAPKYGYQPSQIELADPVETLAWRQWERYNEKYCNIAFPNIPKLDAHWIQESKIDGLVFQINPTCRDGTANIYYKDAIEDILQRKIPALLIESDMVDARTYSEAEVKVRVDAFLDVLASAKEGR